MKKALILCILILCGNCCFSQINGRCIDSEAKPIPYLNISIANSTVGTVTDNNWYFKIPENELSESNTVIFSHLAYNTKSLRLLKKSQVEIIM